MALNILHSKSLQFLKNHRAILLEQSAGAIPHLVRAQIRRVHQNIKRLATRGRLRDIAAAWNAHIQRWIARGNSLGVNIIKLLGGVAAEHKVVMQHVVVLAVQSQIQHNAAARRRIFFGDAFLLARAAWRRHKIAVGALHIAVAHHHIGQQFAAIV